MNAFIYPTPAQLRQAVTNRNVRRVEAEQALTRSFPSIPTVGCPVADPVAYHASPDDTDYVGFTFPPDEDAGGDNLAFWTRVKQANAKDDAERARLKAKRKVEKLLLKARKKFKGKWHSHKGDELVIAEMPTMHLFYAARMIWNHSVPDYATFDLFDGEPMKNYDDVPTWPVRYRRDAWHALMKQLVTRDWDELPSEAYSQYKGMLALSRTLNFK